MLTKEEMEKLIIEAHALIDKIEENLKIILERAQMKMKELESQKKVK